MSRLIDKPEKDRVVSQLMCQNSLMASCDENEPDEQLVLDHAAWRERLKRSAEQVFAGHVISEEELFALLVDDDDD